MPKFEIYWEKTIVESSIISAQSFNEAIAKATEDTWNQYYGWTISKIEQLSDDGVIIDVIYT